MSRKKLEEREQDFHHFLLFLFLYHDPSLQLVGHRCHSTERKEKDDMNKKTNNKNSKFLVQKNLLHQGFTK